MEINDRIAEIIKAKGLNMNSFAKETGINYITLYHTVSPSGRRSDPNAATLLKIKLRFPDIDMNWLITGEGAMMVAKQIKKPEEFYDTLGDLVSELRTLRSEVDEMRQEKQEKVG